MRMSGLACAAAFLVAGCATLARPEMRLRFARAERGELRGGNRNGIRLCGRESAYNAGHA
jgi:hypothetical protein